MFELKADLDDEALGEEVRPMRDAGLGLRLDVCLDKVLAFMFADEETTVMTEMLWIAAVVSYACL